MIMLCSRHPLILKNQGEHRFLPLKHVAVCLDANPDQTPTVNLFLAVTACVSPLPVFALFLSVLFIFCVSLLLTHI